MAALVPARSCSIYRPSGNFGRFVAKRQTTPTAPNANVVEYTVSELSGAVKRALEDGFGYIKLRGEISGYRGPHASGHCYFALKDERARIEAVIWRGVFSRLTIKPEEGMDVIATGKISSYPGSSKYQIVIDALEPAGIGAMMAELEERKTRLAKEGLFDDARKKPLPFLPKTVGVITSPTGAVIRDILAGFTERFPSHVLVWPVKVQGEGSAEEVARAITGMNRLTGQHGISRPDVLIVARGGGSLEDLWSFNDEAVVRAAAVSDIPLISAVGHETDWTLIDLAADARAPTPTKAAEWAVPKHSELLTTLADRHSRLRLLIQRRLENDRAHFKAAARGIPRLDDLITIPRQRFDMLERRLLQAFLSNGRALQTRLHRAASRLSPVNIRQRIRHARQTHQNLAQRLTRALSGSVANHRRALQSVGKLLTTLGYKNVLARGFALVRNDNGSMIRRADHIKSGSALNIEFVDGQIGVIAEGSSPSPARTEPHATKPKRSAHTQNARKSTKSSTGGGGQGSLF